MYTYLYALEENHEPPQTPQIESQETDNPLYNQSGPVSREQLCNLYEPTQNNVYQHIDTNSCPTPHVPPTEENTYEYAINDVPTKRARQQEDESEYNTVYDKAADSNQIIRDGCVPTDPKQSTSNVKGQTSNAPQTLPKYYVLEKK